MNVMFCDIKVLNYLDKILKVNQHKKSKGNKKDALEETLIVFGFCDTTINFLTKEYYDIVEKLKEISKKSFVSFIFVFYIKKAYRNYLSGVCIKEGKINEFFGECFSKKNLILKINKMKFAFLFYYDLYSVFGKEISQKVDVVVGIDDDFIDNFAFLENKFFNKLILVGKNLEIKSKILSKNKKDKKIFANIMYKI